jgi:hypothetical protein
LSIRMALLEASATNTRPVNEAMMQGVNSF